MRARSSATTSTPRTRRPRLPAVVPCPPSFSAPTRFGFVVCAAGATPNSSPVTTATINVNSSTDISMRMSTAGGSAYGGINDWIHFMHRVAHADARRCRRTGRCTTFSISSCRTMRQRLAPSAARTAISLSRDRLRASARFARLAQPISNTNAVAANRTMTAVCNCRADQHVGETVDGNAPALVRIGIRAGDTRADRRPSRPAPARA